MSYLNKKIKKLWNTGEYQSKRELFEAYINTEHGGEPIADKQTEWVIMRICENVIQGGDGYDWIKAKDKTSIERDRKSMLRKKRK